ncbi:MAG: alpha/beta hydrolase [Burkholderiaceae bacterium]|nr:alpha/beta hydrolase [Burkholderiaceae bacterium]MEB2320404.1 alpha/beta hydrolase [Pseudomonadota bacterium]
MQRVVLACAAGLMALLAACSSGPVAPDGAVRGSSWSHSNVSARAVVDQAWVAIPSRATGGAVYSGTLAGAKGRAVARVPVVVVMHGAAGISPALKEWQLWLAETLGIASIAADSMQLQSRLTYTSPVDKDSYERIHELRRTEIVFALQALTGADWADTSRLALAGIEEGAVAAARYDGPEFSARLLFGWSCENNFFVKEHGTRLPPGRPVLNVISARDPLFSSANSWVGLPDPVGHCGPLLRNNPRAEVLLLGNAPQRVLNMPAARSAAQRFLVESLQP